jgi:hypothetical protein
MVAVNMKRAGENGAEFDIPGGCLLCGGPLAVRVSPAGAYSCCIPCRWVSHPQLEASSKGIEVSYQAGGTA